MSQLIEIHSTELGVWVVRADDLDQRISSHASESEAELAAQTHAHRHGGRVLVHDRYERVHECPDSLGDA